MPRNHRNSVPGAGSPNNALDELAAARAEIEQLRAQLVAQNTPSPRTASPDRLADILEALGQHLTRVETHGALPSAKSSKIPDPPVLTDRKDPTFENWKLQIQGKLRVNADYFLDEEAHMTHVFGHTGSDAQKYLSPRFDENTSEPFAMA